MTRSSPSSSPLTVAAQELQVSLEASGREWRSVLIAGVHCPIAIDLAEALAGGMAVASETTMLLDQSGALNGVAQAKAIVEKRTQAGRFVIGCADFLGEVLAPAIAAAVDAVVLVCRQNVTTGAECQRAQQRLRSAGAHLLGAVYVRKGFTR